MDFQEEFVKSLSAFSSLEGLIFVDPDGEAILYQAVPDDPFPLQLAGAKMPILIGHYRAVGINDQPLFMELQFENHLILSICLKDDYSITAIGNDRKMKGSIRSHLKQLAEKFNREIP